MKLNRLSLPKAAETQSNRIPARRHKKETAIAASPVKIVVENR